MTKQTSVRSFNYLNKNTDIDNFISKAIRAARRNNGRNGADDLARAVTDALIEHQMFTPGVHDAHLDQMGVPNKRKLIL